MIVHPCNPRTWCCDTKITLVSYSAVSNLRYNYSNLRYIFQIYDTCVKATCAVPDGTSFKPTERSVS